MRNAPADSRQRCESVSRAAIGWSFIKYGLVSCHAEYVSPAAAELPGDARALLQTRLRASIFVGADVNPGSRTMFGCLPCPVRMVRHEDRWKKVERGRVFGRLA